jgi:hypothetical protein
MALAFESYIELWVETYFDPSTQKRRARPLPNQGYDTKLNVECPKKIRYDFPLGTRHLLKVKLTDRKGEGQFLYSHHTWNPIKTTTPEK